MKLSFRWYGEDDKVTLEQIRQIPGMHSIVTAVYDVPVGEVWSRESIARLKKLTEDAGLHFEVIESIPVHEDSERSYLFFSHPVFTAADMNLAIDIGQASINVRGVERDN